MNKLKKILILSPFFYPEPISTGKFNTDFAKKLQEEGHQVTVLCSHPFYPEWKAKFSSETLENIKIVRGGEKIKYSKKVSLRRLFLELWYAYFILKNFKKYQKHIDIIIPIFPPSLAFYFASFFIKKEVKKIGIIHDLQIIYSLQKKGFFSNLISFFIKKVEKFCFKSCDKLIFLSDEMKKEAVNIYSIRKEKCEVQYPFTSINDISISDNLKNILPKNQHNIVYSGALGEKQNPHELLKIFAFISKNIPNIVCYFFSQGPIFEELKKINNNKKIHFYPLVKKEDIQELYSRSSIQIVPQLPNTSNGSLPSKIPNILVSGTKVLVITDKNSELELLFKKYNLQKVITSWDKRVIELSIRELLDQKIDLNIQKSIAQKLFNINSLIGKVIS
ncbi:glycosyltransferase family 4 protein [Flavobacteriaceae bacterium]|nr:glycosyltransferase family 4 protein [Flavobacteriaceae bacterium]